MGRFVRIYLIPGAVFQSILVGGGYGTGREVVEYFTRLGPLGGLAALAVTFAVFALVLCLTFELARRFRAYDYRSFFRILLGPAWFLYEVVGVVMMMLTFAVLIAAGAGVLEDGFDLPAWIGIALVFMLVAALEFGGRGAVMRVLALWSLVLYAVFGLFLAQVFAQAGASIETAFATATLTGSEWASSGFVYAMYNMTAAPIILYVARDFERPRHTIGAGLAASALAVIPAGMLHVAFASAYPDVSGQDIPVYWMMNLYGMSLLPIAFTIMLFGTLVETGAGVMQGVNERIDNYLAELGRPGLGHWGHTGVAVAFMALALGFAAFGIQALIARGYGTMGIAFLAIYFVPLMTIGVWRLFQQNPTGSPAATRNTPSPPATPTSD